MKKKLYFVLFFIFLFYAFCLFIHASHEKQTHLGVISNKIPSCKLDQSYEDLYVIINRDKFGYINHKGEMIINPIFSWAGNFSEGLAPIRIQSKNGFLDKHCNVKIEPIYDDTGSFSKDGLAAVLINHKWGYIDRDGVLIIQPKYVNAQAFSEGVAAVQLENEKFDFINIDGSPIDHQYEFDEIRSFSEGLAAVKIDINWGYINTSGIMVIEPQYQLADSFSQGLAVVQHHDKQWSYIDHEGNVRITGEYSWANSFSENYASILIDDKWGFIDKVGNQIISTQYDWAGSFSNGLAVVRQGEKLGYIDENGTFMIPPKFSYARNFCNKGIAYAEHEDTVGYINMRGDFIYTWELE